MCFSSPYTGVDLGPDSMGLVGDCASARRAAGGAYDNLEPDPAGSSRFTKVCCNKTAFDAFLPDSFRLLQACVGRRCKQRSSFRSCCILITTQS